MKTQTGGAWRCLLCGDNRWRLTTTPAAATDELKLRAAAVAYELHYAAEHAQKQVQR